jgi:hypothetical protein
MLSRPMWLPREIPDFRRKQAELRSLVRSCCKYQTQKSTFGEDSLRRPRRSAGIDPPRCNGIAVTSSFLSVRHPQDAGDASKEDGQNQSEPDEYPEIVCVIESDPGSVLPIPGRMRQGHIAHARLHVISPPATVHSHSFRSKCTCPNGRCKAIGSRICFRLEQTGSGISVV